MSAKARPHPGSQCGRLLRLLEAANGCKVSLLEILNLRVSQYSARIFELRHRYGFRIENGNEPGHPDHTWFRLIGKEFPTPHVREEKAIQQAMRSELETGKSAFGLFSEEELERGSAWRDQG